jgi:hypothetical protein
MFSCEDQKKATSHEGNKLKNTERSKVELDTVINLFNVNKQKLSEKIKIAIHKIDGRIDRLKEKNNHAKEKMKKEIKQDIEELEFRKTELKKSLKDLKTITKENWRNFKKETEIIIERFEKRFSDDHPDESCQKADSIP